MLILLLVDDHSNVNASYTFACGWTQQCANVPSMTTGDSNSSTPWHMLDMCLCLIVYSTWHMLYSLYLLPWASLTFPHYHSGDLMQNVQDMDRLTDRGHVYNNIMCIMTSAWPCRQCSLMERGDWISPAWHVPLFNHLCLTIYLTQHKLYSDITSSTCASIQLTIRLSTSCILCVCSLPLVLLQYQMLIGAECVTCVWTWTIYDDHLTKQPLVQHVKIFDNS